MFSSFNRRLKSIDFYQAVESDVSEGTACGGWISLSFTIFLIIMLVATSIEFFEGHYKSDLIIDQKHITEKLKVHIDIEFPSYPCAWLSLDIENNLKVHEINIGDTIKKFTLPGQIPYNDSGATIQQQKDNIVQGFKNQNGCRMKGFFQIDRVPGNFHFSCHGYVEAIQQLYEEGAETPEIIDMSHIIHQLYFNEGKNKRLGDNAMKGFRSRKQVPQIGAGITYNYFLDIMQENYFDSIKNTATQSYDFTVRMNEVVLYEMTPPMVLFVYETNPMTVIQISEYKEWHELFVQVVGLVGGFFTLAAIIDKVSHSSMNYLLEKHELGKLI